MSVEYARKCIREQFKQLSLNNIEVTSIGDWLWNIKIAFSKETKLGIDLFCHALQFKTKNEYVTIRMEFTSGYPEKPPYCRIISPQFLPNTGGITRGGNL